MQIAAANIAEANGLDANWDAVYGTARGDDAFPVLVIITALTLALNFASRRESLMAVWRVSGVILGSLTWMIWKAVWWKPTITLVG